MSGASPFPDNSRFRRRGNSVLRITRHIIGQDRRFPWLRHLFADSAYSGDKLAKALTQFGLWTIEIVKRDAPGFVVLPRRWVVERTLAWLNRNRRLAKDFEASLASAKAWLYTAAIQLLIRRLARG
jgi:transposase